MSSGKLNKNMFNLLKIRLGEIDAINEYTEVLLRHSEKEIKSEEEFQIIANESGIVVNDVDFCNVCLHIRKNYIIAVHTEVEHFSEIYLNRCSCLGKRFKKKEDGESLLHAAYKQFNSLQDKKKEEYLLFKICEYYRLIRNQTAHKGKKELNEEYNNLEIRKDEITRLFPKLDAPNKIEELKFDDFLLFSRAIKKLVEIMLNSFEYDDEKLYIIFMKKAQPLKNNPLRLENFILNKLVEEYEVELDKANDLVESIKERILN